jgi:hypothetical protein
VVEEEDERSRGRSVAAEGAGTTRMARLREGHTLHIQQGSVTRGQREFLHKGAAGVASPWEQQGFFHLGGNRVPLDRTVSLLWKEQGFLRQGGGVLLPGSSKDCFTRIRGKMP